jgi:hypothetical protein
VAIIRRTACHGAWRRSTWWELNTRMFSRCCGTYLKGISIAIRFCLVITFSTSAQRVLLEKILVNPSWFHGQRTDRLSLTEFDLQRLVTVAQCRLADVFTFQLHWLVSREAINSAVCCKFSKLSVCKILSRTQTSFCRSQFCETTSGHCRVAVTTSRPAHIQSKNTMSQAWISSAFNEFFFLLVLREQPSSVSCSKQGRACSHAIFENCFRRTEMCNAKRYNLYSAFG